METKTVAKINNVSILMIENGDKFIPIRPICQALGITEDTQRRKIKEDEILSSVATLRVSTGADGKQYEMFCIPFKFVFGWLFTINPKNVKEEARPAVIKYRLECYEVLFSHFADMSEFLKQKQVAIQGQTEEVERIRQDFKNTKQLLDDAKKKLNNVMNLDIDEWKANNRQLKLDFADEDPEEE